MLFPLYMLAALTPPRQSEPEPDPVRLAGSPFSIDIETTGYSMSKVGRPVIRFAPLPPALPPSPLDRRCPVCDAEPGTPCDPARLGKAGRKGRPVHRGR